MTLQRVAKVMACVALLGGCAGNRPIPSGEPTSAPTGSEWIDLLAESRRAAWQNITDDTEIFEFDGDQLHIFGRSLYPLRYAAYTGETFGDFELHLEYKLSANWFGRANSGVFLRVQPDDPVRRGFEIQVLDDHGLPPSSHRSGALYDIASPMYNLSRPAGEWNSYDMRLEGTELSVVMNGWLVLQVDLAQMTEPLGKFPIAYADLPREGMIALQDHGGEAWYRNIRVRRLDQEEQAP